MPPRRSNRVNNEADPAFTAAITHAITDLLPTLTARITDEIRQNKNNGNNGNQRNSRRGNPGDWYQRHGYREQGQNLNYNHISFSAIKVLRATTFRNKTMSSPNRSTSDIEDAFSSMNILNYTSVSLDYFPASAGSNSFNFLENSNIIPSVVLHLYNNPYLKKVQAFYAKELPISSPDPITPPTILTPYPVLPPSPLFDP
ncbi:hypothetical protein Tco_0791242 [Tanacetum coccineum]